MSSRFWLKSAPNVKCKPDGKVTPSRFWLKAAPNVKLCKPDGKVTSSRFWLKAAPNVKLCKPDGKAIGEIHDAANENLTCMWGTRLTSHGHCL